MPASLDTTRCIRFTKLAQKTHWSFVDFDLKSCHSNCSDYILLKSTSLQTIYSVLIAFTNQFYLRRIGAKICNTQLSSCCARFWLCVVSSAQFFQVNKIPLICSVNILFTNIRFKLEWALISFYFWSISESTWVIPCSFPFWHRKFGWSGLWQSWCESHWVNSVKCATFNQLCFLWLIHVPMCPLINSD